MTANQHSLPMRFRCAGVLALVLLLCGCPPGKPADTSPSAGQDQVAKGEYPQAALDYIEAALKSPTEGYPALAYTWTVVAQLDRLEHARDGAAIRALIGEQVEQAGSTPPLELVGAWLNCAPEPAVQFIRDKASSDDWTYISAFTFKPDPARRMLANPTTKIVPPKGVSPELARRWLELQSDWNSVHPDDLGILVPISEREGEPSNTLRAAGWILRLEPENKRFLDYLTLGINSMSTGKPGVMMGAAEGLKISRSDKLAEPLVPLAALTPLKKGKPVQTIASASFVAYALAYLPGEQAAIIRRKLLDAQDATVQWQARMGELLHGDPKPWDEAIAQTDMVKEPQFWIAMETVEDGVVELLPTLSKMAEAEDASLRLRAASFLSRFRSLADNSEVTTLLDKLSKDEVPEVRAAAWYSAGALGFGEPLVVLADAKETPEVRLAAACCALLQAQDGPPSVRWKAADAEAAKQHMPKPETSERNTKETEAEVKK